MNSFDISKKHINFLTFLVFIIIAISLYISLRYSYLHGDVFHEGLSVSIENFYRPIHGRYFIEILQRSIGIANIYGIHPNDYISSITVFINIVIYFFICYIISKSIYLFKNIDIFFPFYILLSYILSILLNCIEIRSYTQFYGYSTMLIFFFTGLNIIIKFYTLNYKELTKKEITFISLLAIFLGNASIFSNVIFFILLLILFTENFINILIANKFLIKKTLIESLENIKKFKTPIILFISFFLLTYLNPFFSEHAKIDKGITFSTDFFVEKMAYYNEFVVEFYNKILLGECSYILTIILLLLVIKFLKNKDENTDKFIRIIIYTLVSLLFFFLILGCFGKTYYFGGFWLQHRGLNLLRITTYLYLIYCCFGKILSIFTFDKLKHNLINTIVLGIIFLFLIFSNQAKDTLEYWFIKQPNFELNIKTNYFIMDYISLFYLDNEKDIILPISLVKNFSYSDYILYDYFAFKRKENADDYKLISEYEHEKFNLNKYTSYLELAYKRKVNKKIKIVTDKEGYKSFENNGGKLDNEKIKKLKFKNLINKTT